MVKKKDIGTAEQALFTELSLLIEKESFPINSKG